VEAARVSLAVELGDLDQSVRHTVDHRRVNLRWHTGKSKSCHAFFVNNDRPDFNPIINLSSQVRTLLEQLSVTCPDLIVTRCE
jgi:uncharacterized protein involved in tellurium resistance